MTTRAVSAALEAVERGAGLQQHERLGLAGLALLERLADAHDRDQPGAQHGRGLALHRGVDLAEVLAALGVADDHELAAGVARAAPR